jgi:predicted alpha/beta-hydrolase family hydrolase
VGCKRSATDDDGGLTQYLGVGRRIVVVVQANEQHLDRLIHAVDTIGERSAAFPGGYTTNLISSDFDVRPVANFWQVAHVAEMTERFLILGPSTARQTILLAHGAGGPMDSPAMTRIAEALCQAGFRIARFEFSYMASRRTVGNRRPPPRAETLRSECMSAVDELCAHGPLIIGGKSMGGRVASMVADELLLQKKIAGLLCLGYPFHPIGHPEKPRTTHLADLQTPTLICQGTRDPFGSPEEIAGYDLSSSIKLKWFADADHDLKPGKMSGFSAADHLQTMATSVVDWAGTL